jgi:hypothetical protein
MGAKTWMLVYGDRDRDLRASLRGRPTLDRAASVRLAGRLFPGEALEALPDGDLCDTAPAEDVLQVGCFAGVAVVAAREFGIDRPSLLPPSFVEAGTRGTLALHAMHSVVDWFAFAVWQRGRLVRSLSLAPDSGILEDIGQELPFEEAYWSGHHPVFADVDRDDAKAAYPFPFHPLELGEAALGALFGYRLAGAVRAGDDPAAALQAPGAAAAGNRRDAGAARDDAGPALVEEAAGLTP